MKHFFKYFSIFVLSFLLFCCNNNKVYQNENLTNDFAKGFKIENFEYYKKISVYNKWQNVSSEIFEYYLVNDKNLIPDSLKDKIIVEIPVKRVVCLSTTHLGFIEKLDVRESVIGLSGTEYVYDSIIQSSIQSGFIEEVGYEQNLNIEKILNMKPDVVFAYDISGNQNAKYEQLKKLGVTVVFVGEYLENEPLGKAEWLKFFASFYCSDSLANTYFDEIKNSYLYIKESVTKDAKKPGILLNSPFQGVWYLPGGQSYMAKLIKDAGGNYIWKNNTKTESFSVSLEEIFYYNDSIDILLNPGVYENISGILKTESRIGNLNCIIRQNVYNNNKRLSSKGGNDFWESGTVNPHLILRDLILIFNGKNDSTFYYYKKLPL